MLMLASKLINLKTAVEAVFRINLKTAVGPCKKAQSFDPEPLDAGVAFTFWECSTPASRGSGSKSCTFLHGPTAVFRIIHPRGLWRGPILHFKGDGALVPASVL